MAVDKLYLSDLAPAYTPATIRGAWEDTAAVVTRRLVSSKTDGGEITSVSQAETSASSTFDVLLYRGITTRLASQTFAGTLDVMIGVSESDAAANFQYYLHVYATIGDSDSVRSTLVSDYVDTFNEWGINPTANGRGLFGPRTLTGSIQNNDRIVVEVGYRTGNSSSSSFTGTLNYGTEVGGSPVSDLTAGGDGTSLAGYIIFSPGVTELGEPDPSSGSNLNLLFRRNINNRTGARSPK